MPTRRQARETALKFLYQYEYNSREDIGSLLSRFHDSLGQTKPDPYAESVIRGVHLNWQKINEIIQEASRHWSLERMDPIDKCLLRLATFEMIFSSEPLPLKVVINEAIEISKKYGSEESKNFVNGILDQISRNQEKVN